VREGGILVIGAPLLDVSHFGCDVSVHVETGAQRISNWAEQRTQAGGAGNVAVQVRNCAPFDCHVQAALVIGECRLDELRQLMSFSANDVFRLPGSVSDATAKRVRYYVDAGPTCAVQVDSGHVAYITQDSLPAIGYVLDSVKPDAVLLYDHGDSDVSVCHKLAALLAKVPVVVVATRRPLCAGWLGLGSNAVVVSNRREFLGGEGGSRASYVITGDTQGAFVRPPIWCEDQRVPSPYVPSPFVTGAGDAFAAVLTVAMTEQHKSTATRDLVEATRLACLGASLYVRNAKRQVPRIEQLQDISYFTLRRLVESPADAVFAEHGFDLLPGCFDCLHEGHKQLISAAAANRRQLLVAVNTDDSVRDLKGRSRPIRPLQDRMLDIAHWAAASCRSNVLVTAFDGDTHSLLRQLPELPQNIVKGSEYLGKSVPGDDVCPVKLLPMFGDFSTTKMQSKR
jgi:cytidyltransferase-like protein